MINFAIRQSGTSGQSGAVLSQICIFVCGLNLFLPFLRIDFASNLPATLCLNLSFETAEFICLLDLDFGKFARFSRQIYLAFCRLKTALYFM